MVAVSFAKHSTLPSLADLHRLAQIVGEVLMRILAQLQRLATHHALLVRRHVANRTTASPVLIAVARGTLLFGLALDVHLPGVRELVDYLFEFPVEEKENFV